MKMRTIVPLLLLGTAVVATSASAGGATADERHRVQGAATTMLEGGTRCS
jgi:hypothetical protein